MPRDRLRLWISRHLQPIAFLGAYFVTIVVGNLIYASPLAHQSLAASVSSDRFLAFPHTFTPGYWALLLCPFALTPAIALITRQVSGPWVGRVVRALPEFGRLDYAVVTAVCFAFVIGRFWLADVSALFASGVDAASSVEARFTIRERLGFVTLTPLQALLPFLALYALVRWLQTGAVYWMGFTLANTFVLSVLLIMINMKWPVLLFYVGIVLTIFVFARRRPYLKTAIGGVMVFVAFLMVSSFVFRLAPASRADATPARIAVPAARPAGAPDAGARPQSEARDTLSEASERFVATTLVAPSYTTTLLMIALNRMAISYPYYYQVFTAEGPVCGGILAQARRNPTCRPSEMIYARIFPGDGFENRGTSPTAVHISGYALGGWLTALFALTAGSVILGLFMAIPLDQGPMAGTLTILGAITGYHLSQIPGEGVIVYEHGLLWILLLLLGYVAWRRLQTVVRHPASGRTLPG